ncbi:MAG TPA: response regulator [Chloroflexi bacterium]|nr:response regulator [Chloroflexota bacterium]
MSDTAPFDFEQDDANAEFQQSVRSALLHLYDNAFLQNHPLTATWAGATPGDRLTHVQDLRRALLDSIERLRPQSAAHGDAARAYAVLTYRCVDGLTIEEIEHKLGLSRRQTYRELNKGVEAVAAQLQDLLGTRMHRTAAPSPATPASLSRRELAEAELARLSQAVRREVTMLADVVNGVCHLLEARLQRRCMLVTQVGLQDAPPVLADRTLLRQALLNLLSYALDVLPEGAHLTLTATALSGAVTLHVQQTPVPDDTRTAPHEREGVALTVAHALLAAQSGRLLLEESASRWTAEIVLPAAQTPTILVIDDNRGLIELFQRYLAGHRVVVVGAESGHAALALLQQLTPQAIVLDVMMPHQDGWEVLQMLRALPALAETPILVCSVLRERDLALSLGASDALVKPVSQPALLDALRQWLGTLHPVE